MPTAKFTLHLRWFVAVLSMPVIGSVVPIRAADQNQAPQQVTRSVPPVDKTTKIEISSPSGWWIRIFPNSDGVLAGASSFEWGVTFPVEAFDFEQLYRTVLKNAVASGRDQTHYSIHFFGGDDPGYGSVASLDEKNILAIFQRAKSCAYRSMIPRHFEKAWKERGPRLSKLGEQRIHPGKAASARNDSVDGADLLTRAQRFRKIEAQVDSVWVFERRWRRQIFPKLEEQQHPLAKRVDQWIRQDKGLWARRMTFNECRQFVDRTLPAEEREKSIFYGSVANLKQEGTCWILHTVSAEVADECIAFLDDAGKVLLVWYATDMKFHPPTKGIDSSRIERMPPPGPEKRNGDRSTKTDSATDFRRIQGAWKTIPRTSNVDGKDTDVREVDQIVFQGNRVIFLPKDSKDNRGQTFSLIEQSTPKMLIIKSPLPIPRDWEDRPFLFKQPPPHGGPNVEAALPYAVQWGFAYSLKDDTLRLGNLFDLRFLVDKKLITKESIELAPHKADTKFNWVLERVTNQTR